MTLPPGATFVVANCLAPMNKAATSHYNCRVMECRLACQIMAKKAGKNSGSPLYKGSVYMIMPLHPIF